MRRRTDPSFKLTHRGKNYGASDAVKGDLFVILGACCYGISNVLEEFLVSKRPLYEVVGQVWNLVISSDDRSDSGERSLWAYSARSLSVLQFRTPHGMVPSPDTS